MVLYRIGQAIAGCTLEHGRISILSRLMPSKAIFAGGIQISKPLFSIASTRLQKFHIADIDMEIYAESTLHAISETSLSNEAMCTIPGNKIPFPGEVVSARMLKRHGAVHPHPRLSPMGIYNPRASIENNTYIPPKSHRLRSPTYSPPHPFPPLAPARHVTTSQPHSPSHRIAFPIPHSRHYRFHSRWSLRFRSR